MKIIISGQIPKMTYTCVWGNVRAVIRRIHDREPEEAILDKEKDEAFQELKSELVTSPELV